jgi:putative flippase GtrA
MNDLFFDVFSRKSAIQLLRYGLLGIATNSVGFIIYLIFTYLGTTPKITMTFLYGVGVAISFWGNRKWTFIHNGSVAGTSLRYIVAHGAGYFINLTILIVMVDKLGYAHQWVQALAVFTVAAFLFIAFKFYVFRNLESAEEAKK